MIFPRILLQRSWYFYRNKYGTLSLLIYTPSGKVIRKTLFEWYSPFWAQNEPEFRQLLNQCPPPPWKGLKGHLTRALYTHWDKFYPTRVRLYNPSRFMLFMGRLVGEYYLRKK